MEAAVTAAEPASTSVGAGRLEDAYADTMASTSDVKTLEAVSDQILRADSVKDEDVRPRVGLCWLSMREADVFVRLAGEALHTHTHTPLRTTYFTHPNSEQLTHTSTPPLRIHDTLHRHICRYKDRPVSPRDGCGTHDSEVLLKIGGSPYVEEEGQGQGRG